MAKKRVTVMIPTYNERENIREVIEEILRLNSDLDLSIIVVDDNSPDGTSRVVEEIAAKDPRVHLLLRTKRRGRGAAGIDGFKASLQLQPDFIIEMDGDGSHQPKFIPDLVRAAASFDIVLGSRFVPGGRDADRSLSRRIITWLVRLFIRWQFHFPVKDVSSGFRCFRAEALEKLDLDDFISVGPSVVLEVLARAHRLGLKLTEIPITFIDRQKGETKLNLLTLLETLVMTLKFKKMFGGTAVGK